MSTEKLAMKSLNEAIGKAGISRNDIKQAVFTGIQIHNPPITGKYERQMLCLAKGIFRQAPTVQTVIDLGAQKYMALRCRKGIPIKFVTNDKCAIGTGRFLQVVADLLNIPMQRMGEIAKQSKNDVEVSSTCAIFAETEIISLIHQGHKSEDILAGVIKGFTSRIYATLLSVGIEKDLAIVGGGARNRALVKAIERNAGSKAYVPDEPEIVGAVGAALMAEDHQEAHI